MSTAESWGQTALCSSTERHLVVSVCSHSQKGHSEPAGAGGAGDVQPGVVSWKRVGGGGGGGRGWWGGGGGWRRHGYLRRWRPRVHAETEWGFFVASVPSCLKGEWYMSLPLSVDATSPSRASQESTPAPHLLPRTEIQMQYSCCLSCPALLLSRDGVWEGWGWL